MVRMKITFWEKKCKNISEILGRKLKKGIEIQTYCLCLNPFRHVSIKYYQYIPLENPGISATIIFVGDVHNSFGRFVVENGLSF